MHDNTIKRILKVNHAGEFGAIRIYCAQLGVSRLFHAELVPFLTETLAHEIEHARKFREAMPARKARPCAAMPLWGVGGWMLGAMTALMGKNAVMICTAAVERAVHQHLNQQIHYLAGRDEELKTLIENIQKEEIMHLQYAEQRIRQNYLVKPLTAFIRVSTEIVIWLSTQGDVTKMKTAIAQN